MVTGASRGIGRAIALAFAREGAAVALNCSTSVESAEEVFQEIKGLGQQATVVQADVADKMAVEEMVKKVVAELDRINILVNNAGISVIGTYAELEENRCRRGIDVKQTGVFFCSQAAGAEVIKRRSGKVINIASVNGIGAFPERVYYGSAKVGVMQLTRALGYESARFNINVNAIAPGYLKTHLVVDLVVKGILDEEELPSIMSLCRLGKCEEIADAAVFLASEESKYIVGQTIVVDGGWSAYAYLESWLAKAKDID